MRIFYNIKYMRSAFLYSLLLTLLISSCTKKEILGEDPYAGGKEALGVRFIGKYPKPESGAPGSEVTYTIDGLKAWENKFEFRINDQPAEVVNLTDSTISVIVPQEVSSGGASIKLEGQVFFGPRFEVAGNVSIDQNYNIVNGTNGPISDAINYQSGHLFVGSFSNFENKASTTSPINGIVAVSAGGEYEPSINAQKGPDGSIQTISRLASGKLIVGGVFTTFNERKGMFSLTRLNADGSLDSIRREVNNPSPDKPLLGWDTVATFNGQIYGSVNKTFVSQDPIKGEQITVVGSFKEYGSIFWERATRDYQPVDIVKIPQVLRMNVDGEIDRSYNFDDNGKNGNPGGNGSVSDAFLQDDNKLVLVGDFTTFHSLPANRIVRLDNDGKVDPSFDVGSGANDAIYSMQHDPISGKFLLVGAFTSFNGQPTKGIIRLNQDGTVDPSFKLLEFEGGSPHFAHQLKNGKVLITGSFLKYNKITRRGFLVLNNDGSISQQYNNAGAFQGEVSKVIETTSALGNPAVLLMGYINMFNDQRVGNMVQIEIKD